METTTYVGIYIFGWFATAIAMIDRPTLTDIAASFVVGAFWPVLIPAQFIRRLRR